MRKDSIFNDVMKMPWPVGVGFAAVVFFVFHTYQLVAPQDAMNQAVLSAFKMVAYLLIGMLGPIRGSRGDCGTHHRCKTG